MPPANWTPKNRSSAAVALKLLSAKPLAVNMPRPWPSAATALKVTTPRPSVQTSAKAVGNAPLPTKVKVAPALPNSLN